MGTDSTNTMCNGATLSKAPHHFSGNPPTTDATDNKSLEEYRLGQYRNAADSIPLPHVQAGVSESNQTARQVNVAAEMNANLARLGGPTSTNANLSNGS